MATETLTDSLSDTLALFDVGRPRTTSEVAEDLDLGRRSTYERLDRLVEHDRLETKKAGASARVWWRPPSVGDDPPSGEAAAGDQGGEGDHPDLVENLPGMVYRCRAEPGWSLEFVGGHREDLFGYEPAALESGPVEWVEDVVHPEDRERAEEAVLAGLEDDGEFAVQYRVRTADGGTRWVHDRGHLVDGGTTIEGVVTDVTEQKEAEQALREERERFQSLVQAVEEYAIFTLDADGHVRSWNDGAARIKGYDREEILGRHFSTFYTREDARAGVPESNLAAAAEDGSAEDEGWRVRKDGSRFWAHVTITAIRDDDGDLTGYAKVTRDTTDRRDREQAVRRERNLLENVLEASSTGIGIFHADGRARRVNGRFAELLCLGDEAAGEHALGDRPLRDEAGEVLPYAERPAPWALATGERVERRVRVDGPDGRTRWLSMTAEPLDGDEGVVVSVTDVTPLKERTRRLERRREELEGELEEVFERVDDGMFALDRDLRFTHANDRAGELLGRPHEELPGEHVWDAVESDPEVDAAFAEAMETQESVSVETFYGAFEAWFEVHVYPSESGLSVHFRDVTERKEREERLERYGGILEAIGEPAYELDDGGRFTFVNDAFVEYAGYERSELLGEHVSIGLDEAVIEEAEALLSAHLAGDETRSVTLEFEVETADGERRPVENRFSVLTDDEGRFQGTAGMLLDLTERRERQRELERYETVVESIEDGVYVVDDEWRFTRVNRAYAEMTGYAPEELVGEHVSTVVDEEVMETAREMGAALDADEPVPDVAEVELRTADGGSFPAAASFAVLEDDDGDGRRVGVVRDVSERKQYEEALAGLYDASRELFRAGTEAAVDEAVVEMARDVIDVPGVAAYRYDEDENQLYPAAQSVEPGFEREELPAVPPDDSSITGHVYATSETWLYDDVNDSEYLQDDATEMRSGVFAPMGDHGVLVAESRAVGAFDDRTRQLVELLAESAAAAYDRVERERELQRYETIVETVNEGIYVVDADRNFTWVNESYAELLGYDREELIDEHVTEIVDDDAIREAEGVAGERGPEHLPRMDVELVTASGDHVTVDAASTVLPGGEESDWFRAGVVRDITERKERERAIEESERRYRTLVDNFPNGAVVMFDEDLRYLTVGGEIYDGLDFTAGDLEGDTVADRLPGELAEKLGPRYRAVFDGDEREFEVEFDGEVRRFRVLPVHDDDGEVFAGMAMTQDVTWRRERERELERQREHLAALNNLNDVVHEITDAVVDQSTREEIEATVCEHLAATDSYAFAWVGDVDVASETVTLRTEAGVEGYLDDVAISVDPDDERGNGPTARAVRTREMQTTRDVQSDPDYEPWRDHAEAHGVRSSAAIPIVHEDTVFGVLNVYADRPDAFEGEERTVVGQLGEVVGHAIAATERKRALMSDEVVELEFRIPDVFEGLDVDGPGDGTITLDHAVPVEDGEYVVYGTATEEAVPGVRALAGSLPHWTDVTFRDDAGGVTGFELRLSDPPVLSRVASVGGSVEEAVYEDGDYWMTLHLPPGADVRRIVDATEAAYPTAEMVKRSQTTSRDGTPKSLGDRLADELTDRQQVALEAAYHGGFFEWPREVSGGQVADTLDVSPPTFHQHLREAERKVLGAVLSSSAAP